MNFSHLYLLSFNGTRNTNLSKPLPSAISSLKLWLERKGTGTIMQATSLQTKILVQQKRSLFQNHHAGAVLRLPGTDALGRPLATTFWKRRSKRGTCARAQQNNGTARQNQLNSDEKWRKRRTWRKRRPSLKISIFFNLHTANTKLTIEVDCVFAGVKLISPTDNWNISC